MIELITGLPGNGKTLYTLGMVKRKAEAENRPVFYAGIPEVTLDWEVVDPADWMSVPPGSIVVIDEAQKTFRARSVGKEPPDFVKALETHRHNGLDLFLITQHPSLIDASVRRLAGSHRHLIRMFGMEVSTVHQWDSVRDNCDKAPARNDSNKTKWPFDKKLFGLYKSADVHTVKRSIPFRVKMLFVLPLLLVGAFFLVKNILFKDKDAQQPAHVAGALAPGVPAQVGGVDRPKEFDALADAKFYVATHTPRIAGLPHTAPMYDELTKPVRVPVPAACIQSGPQGTRCKCLTQQGTPMEVKFNMCIEFARNGFFQEFDAERDRAASERTAQSVKVMDKSQPLLASNGSQVTVLTEPPPFVPYRPQVSGLPVK